jgi:hypothetical protein
MESGASVGTKWNFGTVALGLSAGKALLAEHSVTSVAQLRMVEPWNLTFGLTSGAYPLVNGQAVFNDGFVIPTDTYLKDVWASDDEILNVKAVLMGATTFDGVVPYTAAYSPGLCPTTTNSSTAFNASMLRWWEGAPVGPGKASESGLRVRLVRVAYGQG